MVVLTLIINTTFNSCKLLWEIRSSCQGMDVLFLSHDYPRHSSWNHCTYFLELHVLGWETSNRTIWGWGVFIKDWRHTQKRAQWEPQNHTSLRRLLSFLLQALKTWAKSIISSVLGIIKPMKTKEQAWKKHFVQWIAAKDAVFSNHEENSNLSIRKIIPNYKEVVICEQTFC